MRAAIGCALLALTAAGCRGDWQALNGDLGAFLHKHSDLGPTLIPDGFFPDATVSVGADPNVDFVPATVTVSMQGAVTWIWRGGTHNLVSDSVPPAWDPTDPQQNGGHGQIFSKPGTYPYHCGQHPAQNGTVEVVP